MKYSVLIAEASTGIILKADAESRQSGSDLPYLNFDSLDEIRSYANRTTSLFGQLEFIVYDEFHEYLEMVYPKKY
ncbi:hypothetical protein GCM10028822_07740 [Hymenobacter terrigena]